MFAQRTLQQQRKMMSIPASFYDKVSDLVARLSIHTQMSIAMNHECKLMTRTNSALPCIGYPSLAKSSVCKKTCRPLECNTENPIKNVPRGVAIQCLLQQVQTQVHTVLAVTNQHGNAFHKCQQTSQAIQQTKKKLKKCSSATPKLRNVFDR